MKAWLSRFLAPRHPPARAQACSMRGHVGERSQISLPVPVRAQTPRRDALPLRDQASQGLEFLAWLADGAGFSVGPAGLRERAALQHLDHLIADEASHHMLLPRAAAVIPPLLARLRNPSVALPELTQQVSRDVTLVAEVVRMANSPYYRRDTLVVELDHAIRVLGIEGLRRAIVRALVKPVIDARGGRLVTSSAGRLWDHSDKKAQLCSALAPGMGCEPFEAYLAGLAHNAVWSAVLRTMDEVDGESPWHLSPAFTAALGSRRDRLFAVVASQWALPDNMARAAIARATQGAGTEVSAPMRLLYTGDRLAWLLCSPDRGRAAALAEPWLCEVGAPVRACYEALEQAAAA